MPPDGAGASSSRNSCPHPERRRTGSRGQQLSTLAERHGLSPGHARAHTRLGIAVVRGLLLDLLATGDRRAVDEAMELFITSYQRLLAH